MSNNKKAKTTTDEFDTVQQYLLECPLVSQDSSAIQAALSGLQQERKRMERDEKLLKKFALSNNNGDATEERKTAVKNEVSTSEYPKNKNTKKNEEDPDPMMEEDEWQDVATTSPVAAAVAGTSSHHDMDDNDSPLGKQLAQGSIQAMAQAGVLVKDPLSAIALALHGALLQLEFVCTGVPLEELGKGQGGFAPPIRPLSKNQFVPVDWDAHSSESENALVALRYRKDKVGAVHLVVKQIIKEPENHQDNVVVQVQLTPAHSDDNAEPHPTHMEFALMDHFNQDSFQAAYIAAGGEKRVLPALHYKALSVFMTKFCNTFDLGPIKDDLNYTTPLAATAASTQPSTQVTFRPATSTPGEVPPRFNRDPLRVYNQHDEPHIGQFQQPHSAGDFGGDLLPSGLVDPNIVPQLQPGNLMGPNHPAFTSGGGPPRLGGGLDMKPRFDPYGPPGGPTDPNNPDNLTDPNHPLTNKPHNKKPPPGGTGEPNPDHERPPSNMYL